MTQLIDISPDWAPLPQNLFSTLKTSSFKYLMVLLPNNKWRHFSFTERFVFFSNTSTFQRHWKTSERRLNAPTVFKHVFHSFFYLPCTEKLHVYESHIKTHRKNVFHCALCFQHIGFSFRKRWFSCIHRIRP